MTTIKYTDDGKKVLVVGKLNAEQTIVQEIFVSNGQEIPSGENFVVKSLHDAPAESWKTKNLRELEQRYETDRKKLQDRIDAQAKRLYAAEQKARLQANALLAFAEKSNADQLETLKKFMAGQITHMFVDGYRPEIVSWYDDNESYQTDNWHGSFKVEGIKLISLYGSSEGDLSFKINKYRDGSGCDHECLPAGSYQEALAIAQNFFDRRCESFLDGSYPHLDLQAWQKLNGIVVPQAAIDKYELAKTKAKRDRIASLKEELAKLEQDCN